MRVLPIVCAAVATAASAAAAAAQPLADEGRARAELMARALDADRDGVISEAELARLTNEVFASVDVDANGALDVEEVAGWQFGMADLAAYRGREQAYGTAVAIVVDLFDRDGDETITREEHERGVASSIAYADQDGDGSMSVDEYLDGFIYNIAMRNALGG